MNLAYVDPYFQDLIEMAHQTFIDVTWIIIGIFYAVVLVGLFLIWLFWRYRK